MTEADICVMVPTIREYECMRDYFENARRHGFDLERLYPVLITEDFCDTGQMKEMLNEEIGTGEVFDGTRRKEWFSQNNIEEFSHLIPEASHAETSFGLLYMWNNPQFDYGIFIDDDTLPHEDSDFFGRHLQNLNSENTTVEKVQSDEKWVNVLYQNVEEHGLYPRGYPYSAMGEARDVEQDVLKKEVVASQGLWTNIPDLDAVRILMDGDLNGQAKTLTSKTDFTQDFVAKKGQYLTVCSMNLAFKREVIPAFYQLPMDENEWDVGRFDDIWSGVFLKRAADVLDKQIYNGFPLCQHNKAPRSTFGDLNNEVPGLELNEHVWEIVDEVGGGAESYDEAFEEMADAMIEASERDYINSEFYRKCGEYMKDWLSCLEKL